MPKSSSKCCSPRANSDRTARPRYADSRNLFVLQHAPEDRARTAFYSVVRAGHGKPTPGDVIARDTYPGHELVYCLRGRGSIRFHGAAHQVRAGGLAWVNCHHPHGYFADSNQPWEYYWIRVEGPQLDHIAALLQESGGPVVQGLDQQLTPECFERIFALLREHGPAMPALVHAEVAWLIAQLFKALHPERRAADAWPTVPENLRPAFEQMRLYFHLPFRVPELARMSGLSESQFTRTFREALGSSPIDWLRQERIAQAKRRLLETKDTIKEIARQVGYSDQFYFSRDFKKMVGLSPTEFRDRGPGELE